MWRGRPSRAREPRARPAALRALRRSVCPPEKHRLASRAAVRLPGKPMRVKAAVLNTIGLPPPYASSRPLEILELDLAPPGRGELMIRVMAAGPMPFRSFGYRRLAAAPRADGAGARGRGSRRTIGEGVTDLSVGDHVVLVFVPSCGRCGPAPRDARALRAGGAASQRRRDAARRRAAALVPRRAGSITISGLGFRHPCGGRPGIAA